MVRAKFKFVSYTTDLYTRIKVGMKYSDPDSLETVETRTLKFSPVYGNGDPEHENTKFWSSTPSGHLELGTVNPEAWKHFELGKDYYLDFTPAA